ncbi:MAG: hypothetical protein WCL27_13125 [Betaproteobacteria bacterium]
MNTEFKGSASIEMIMCGYEFIVAGYVILGVECNKNHGQWAIETNGEHLVCLSKEQVEKAEMSKFMPCEKSTYEKIRKELQLETVKSEG